MYTQTPKGPVPGSKVVAPTIGGNTMRALSDVCASDIDAISATGLRVVAFPAGYQPNGIGPLGENLATAVRVTLPVCAFLNNGAAISSVPDSIFGSCWAVPPWLGLALFWAIPTFSLYTRVCR